MSELRESRFLKKEEVGQGMVVTIADCYQENVAKSGAPEELKWVLAFNETDKPMVLNSINGQLIAQITGSEESEGWMGAQIELYNDPTIAFGGKITGGIRVCAPGARPQTSMQRPQRGGQAPRMQHRPQQQQGNYPQQQGNYPQQQQGGYQQQQGAPRMARPAAPHRQQQGGPVQQPIDMPPDIPQDEDSPY